MRSAKRLHMALMAAGVAVLGLALDAGVSHALQPGGSVSYSITSNSSTPITLSDPYMVLIQPTAASTVNVGAVSMGTSLSLSNAAPTTGTVNFGLDSLSLTAAPSYYSIIGSIGASDLAAVINPNNYAAANGIAFSSLLSNNPGDLALLQQIADSVGGALAPTLTATTAESDIISGLSLAQQFNINEAGTANASVTPSQLDFAVPIGGSGDLFEFSNGTLIGTATVVPDPATWMLLALPVLAMLPMLRRRRAS
jgi:MYXO-CTERM domain-containing protein